MKEKTFRIIMIITVVFLTLFFVKTVSEPNAVFVISAMNGDFDRMKEINEKHKEQISETSLGEALHYAVRDGNLHMVKYLIRNGASANFLKKDIPKQLTPPLVTASILDPENIEIVQFLLDSGADINIKDLEYSGETPVIAALYSKNFKVVELLLDHKPDLKIKNNNGETVEDIIGRNYRRLLTIEKMIEELETSLQNKEKGGEK